MFVLCVCHPFRQIWVRNYQILEQQPENAKEARDAKKQTGETDNMTLVEIGPRFVLSPIRIFRGSFGGQTLFQNGDFVSPNEIRAQQSRLHGRAYEERKASESQRKERNESIVLPDDPLRDVFT